MSDILKDSNLLNVFLETHVDSMVDCALKLVGDKEQQLEASITNTTFAVLEIINSGDLGDEFTDPGWITAVAVQFFGVRKLESLYVSQIKYLILEMLVSIDPRQLFNALLFPGESNLEVLTGTYFAGKSSALGKISSEKFEGELIGLQDYLSNKEGNLNYTPIVGEVNHSYSINYSNIPLEIRIRIAESVKSLDTYEDIFNGLSEIREDFIKSSKNSPFNSKIKNLNDLITES